MEWQYHLIKDIFQKFGEEIKSEVLADAILAGALEGYVKDWNINGEQVKLAVKRL